MVPKCDCTVILAEDLTNKLLHANQLNYSFVFRNDYVIITNNNFFYVDHLKGKLTQKT